MEPQNASTFSDLYRRHAPAVYRFALYLSGDRALAEDIVSETFLRLWDSSVEVRMTTVQGYLFTIARNLFLHELRRRQRQSPLEESDTAAAGAWGEPGSRDDLDDALAALQMLPELDRTALLLRAQEELPYEEIARALGLSLSAAKVKVHRARLRLAELRKRNPVRKGALHGTD